ncbi:hypothetical protein PG987_004844 [Apiospora arundinis]
MLYINEYKAPHKITPQHLRVGLRSMDIYKEVVNRATIPTAADPEALFQYHSERLVAAAITQTFHYMIEGGLEYGLVTTGEAIVFLKVDWSDPTTLLYHLAEPRAEVVAHPRDARYCTAVSQMLAFSLLALDYSQGRRYHRQDEREAVMSSLKTWSEDVETILKSIPVDQRKAPSSSPAYEPDPYSDVDRSPCMSRKRKPRKPPGNMTRIGVPAYSPESSDDENTRRMQETPTPLEPRRSGRIQAAQRALPNHTRKDGHDAYRSRQQNDGYCTEECLRGLTLQTKTRLDENCPNVATHRHDGDGLHHRISHARFVTLLRDQLKRTLDDGIESLDKGGARGVLFKVTLLAYGYTFIGKGTVPAFIEDLEHEAKVYQALQPLQGKVTPIFLGAIDLRTISRTYYYDFRVRVQYMMFLSWGGASLDSVRTAGDDGDLSRQLIHAIRALHTCGVAHKDLRSPNVLINQETGQIRICDFERAVLMERPRLPLGSVVIQLQNWPQTVGSTQYVIGTYTTLGAANLAAENALRRAGYEKDQFTTYVRTEPTEEYQGGLVVFAVTLDGVEFQIQLCRTPNAGLHVGAAGSQRVAGDIWHVLQTVMSYHSPTGESKRDFICGTFPSYEAAKSQAYSLLLNCGDPSSSSNSSSNGNQNDEISPFVHYEEVDAAELDGSKGDCILVRAISKDGTNYLINLAKGYDMEGLRWVDVARRG